MPSKEFRRAAILTTRMGKLLDKPTPPADQILQLGDRLCKYTGTPDTTSLVLSAFLTDRQFTTLRRIVKKHRPTAKPLEQT
jgi:hypothetical protein